ncbi:tripartite tricarboxylate transporter substrate binding protein [soil metagenome]
MNRRQSIFRVALTIAATTVTGFDAWAAEKYPVDRVTLVVPYSPGNGLDLLGREYARALQPLLGASVIVENREGAAGVIGTSMVARTKPDGATLLFTAHPPFATAPVAVDNPPYNPIESFAPIARVASAPLALVTSSNSPIKSVDDLKSYAKANPGGASYASAGPGSPGQLYGELLGQALGVALQEVPYKATGQALTDVIAGNVLVSLVSVTAAAQHVASGSLRVLAVGSRQRMKEYANVPTLAEATGRADFQAGVWYGFFAPAGASRELIDRLNRDIVSASASAPINEFLSRSMMIPDLQDPAQFAASLAKDLDIAKTLARNAKLKGR